VIHWNATKLTHSAAERRLRVLAEIVTTQALRQTLLDAAATYDKLARSAAFGRRDAAE